MQIPALTNVPQMPQEATIPVSISGAAVSGVERRQLNALAVYTGSALGTSPEFAAAATEFAELLAAQSIRVIYGGGRVGLMGVVADSALAAGGEVFGVITEALMNGEVGHAQLTRLEIVPDMHIRKARMEELADGFVALPGGVGTLEELFEVWTWQQLGIHEKPVALLNTGGFWDPLLYALDQMAEQGFITERFRHTLIVTADPAELLQRMADWQPEAPKWPTHAELVQGS